MAGHGNQDNAYLYNKADNTPDGAAVAQSVEAPEAAREAWSAHYFKCTPAVTLEQWTTIWNKGAAWAGGTELRDTLQGFLDYHTKPSAITSETIVDKAAFKQAMADIDASEASLIAAALRSLASSTTPSPAGMARLDVTMDFDADDLGEAGQLTLTLYGSDRDLKLLAVRLDAYGPATTPPTAPSGDVRKVIEPTEAMVDAACEAVGLCREDRASEEVRQEYRVAYRAMAFAALASIPPAKDGDVEASK